MKFTRLVNAMLLSGACIASLSLSNTANAAAYQLYEQNVSGLGNAHAGMAVDTNDASVAYYNPAGLVYLDGPQVTGGVTIIQTNIKFTGRATDAFLGDHQGVAEGGNGSMPIPTFSVAIPLTNKVSFGFASVVPFGLATQWELGSVVASSATETDLQDFDLTPSLAIKLPAHISVGAGMDFERVIATFSQEPIPSADKDEVINKGNAWGAGWHAGVMYQPTSALRLGLSYHSQVSLTLRGASNAIRQRTGENREHLGNTYVKTKLPYYATASALYNVSPKLTLLGTAQYNHWDTLQNLTLHNVASGGLGPIPSITIHEGFKNVWLYALGLNYHYDQDWTFRAGVNYDETPTNDLDRDIRLPDNNRFGIAVGVHHRINKHFTTDVGYQHLFLKEAPINKTLNLGPLNTSVNGNVKASANIWGVQLTWLM